MNLSAFFFADKLALTLFHLSPEAQVMALQVMQWFNLFSIFFWPSSFTLPNILRAAGDASFTMSVSIVSMWVFRVGFCYLMVLCFHGPAAQHLDGYVPGLGVPLRLLYGPLCAGQVAGTARDLKFHIFRCKILPLCLV